MKKEILRFGVGFFQLIEEEYKGAFFSALAIFVFSLFILMINAVTFDIFLINQFCVKLGDIEGGLFAMSFIGVILAKYFSIDWDKLRLIVDERDVKEELR